MSFKRTFTEDEKDINLKEKLKTELPGIFNWALIGLDRLRRNGHFTQSDLITESINEFRREINSVLAWREECVEIQEKLNRSQKATDFYQNYAQWCKDTKQDAVSKTMWGKKMKKIEGVNWDRKSGNIFYNIKLKKNY